MSFQYIPSSHGRVSNRLYPSSTTARHVGPPDDWMAEQSLFMGLHTPHFTRQVSLSPQDTP
jgi:hypothetical protein